MSPATIDPASTFPINDLADALAVDAVLWKRDDEAEYHEGRIIESADGTLAFMTAYADRPDRTDLIDLVIPSSSSAPTRQRMLVSRIDGFDDQHCVVALTDA